jgi:N-acetyl-anhydromuramyl-L-alanine amidase AmpD
MEAKKIYSLIIFFYLCFLLALPGFISKDFFKSELKIIDKTSENDYETRDLNKITRIVIHHSSGPETQDIDDLINKQCENRKWPGCGYHYIIAFDGTIYQTNKLNKIVNGVRNFNTPSIHICMVGNFSQIEPSKAQYYSLRLLTRQLRKEVTTIEIINLHKDKNRTHCPGKNFNSKMIWQ